MTSRNDPRLALPLRPLDGAPGPARPLAADDAELLVLNIVSRFEASALDPALPAGPARGGIAAAERRVAASETSKRPRALPRVTRWLLTAAILAGVGVAAAAATGIIRRSPENETAPSPTQPTPHGSAAAEASSAAPRAIEPDDGSTLRPEEPAVGAAPPASEDSAVAASTAAPPNPRRAPRSRPKVTSDAVGHADAEADDPLAAANRLRRDGRFREAELAYARVRLAQRERPEAYVATLAAAALRLEHLGDPAGALGLYESVAGHGALGEVALFGVARCHRALGHRAGERDALEQLLARYPNAPQRQQAERRLRDLR